MRVAFAITCGLLMSSASGQGFWQPGGPMDPWGHPAAIYPPSIQGAWPPAWGMPAWVPPSNPTFGMPILIAPPQSIVIDRQVIDGAPLPPAQLEMVNSRTDPLRVECIDLRDNVSLWSGELGAGESAPWTIPRDAGGVVVETYQTVMPTGEVVTRKRTRKLVVRPRYEVIVHRIAMQSIAIDRTGKSPSVIEDVQFRGEPIGRFVLPPGDQLADGPIDVFQTAVRTGTAGQIEPIFPTSDDADRRDPLRQAIDELRR